MRPLGLIAALAALALIPGPPGGVVPAYGRVRGGAEPLAVGVHAPNRAWRETDYARVAKGQFGAVKMMSYHPLEAYARVRAEVPGVQFAVRLATPWNELPAPDQFAAANAPYLRKLVDAGYDPWVEIGNEPNLELHPLAEAAFVEWYVQVLAGLRAAVPEAKYGYPGLARDRREHAWWEASAAAIEQSDWLGVHAYWHDAREMLDPHRALGLVALHQRFPRLPILVTEAGNDGFGVSPAERAGEYPQFVRTLARLPYVRAVHFFILSGTADWQRFFFDDALTAAVAGATHDPRPVADGVAEAGRDLTAAVAPLVARSRSARSGGLKPAAPATPVPPAPTPEPFGRRQLLADPAPMPGERWIAAGTTLRTASTYLATDVSVRLEVAAPAAGAPEAIQLADPSGAGPGQPSRTGFTLVWDGERWRLQYRREGALAVDQALVPPAASGDGWYRTELALEPRSAAAWVWPRGAPQPDQPSAVFAPPQEAALDGARPRALYVPGSGVASVVMEGGTRD